MARVGQLDRPSRRARAPTTGWPRRVPNAPLAARDLAGLQDFACENYFSAAGQMMR
jgi:hypothetical protein